MIKKNSNLERNLNSKIQQAIISLKLEGIALSEESLNDLRLFDQGKLSRKEVIERVLARAKNQ